MQRIVHHFKSSPAKENYSFVLMLITNVPLYIVFEVYYLIVMLIASIFFLTRIIRMEKRLSE
ncbi:hypothetical protein [Salinicoccus roseus]|uniref:hypothetical protein n=1 Tax=Salinicoccus roseus TaxID=45670 RepID=UPI001EF57365|nr:hypothetical protein [Salinicoccus roseus]MCG7331215.1 hypothetical protein [Salinicoccus roseus]